MTQLICPRCNETIVDTVQDFEQALVPIIMHHAIEEERNKSSIKQTRSADCYFCKGSGLLTDDSECPCAMGQCPCQYCNRTNGNPDKWCDACHGLGVETSRIDDIHTATTTCLICKGVGKITKSQKEEK